MHRGRGQRTTARTLSCAQFQTLSSADIIPSASDKWQCSDSASTHFGYVFDFGSTFSDVVEKTRTGQFGNCDATGGTSSKCRVFAQYKDCKIGGSSWKAEGKEQSSDGGRRMGTNNYNQLYNAHEVYKTMVKSLSSFVERSREEISKTVSNVRDGLSGIVSGR